MAAAPPGPGRSARYTRKATTDQPVCGEQAVRVRHVIEIEGIRGRKAGDDADLLDAEEHEGRPEDVEQLDGDEQHPERDRRVGFFGRETDAVVTHEHRWS